MRGCLCTHSYLANVVSYCYNYIAMPQLSYNVIISYFQFNESSFPAGSELHYTITSYAVGGKVEDQVK